MGRGTGKGELIKVLVSGDREWKDAQKIRDVLKALPSNTIIVHGNARGADKIAGKVALGLGMKVRVYPAKWDQYGKAAGPIRNQRMLDEEKPDMVIAFHSDLEKSKGTKDMVRRARTAGIARVVCTGKE